MDFRPYSLASASPYRDAVHRAAYAARHKFAWPGGYLLFAVTSDGEALCPACIRENFRLICQARTDRHSSWRILGIECAANYEPEALGTCAHCGTGLATL